MEATLDKISSKINDYKLCSDCGTINFYENEICHSCKRNEFKLIGEGIEDYVNQEYRYYAEQNYSKDESDEIFVNI
ncbi:MAG: hypothetical protein ACYCS1_05435 [Gammaproteobacteria bacterium]